MRFVCSVCNIAVRVRPIVQDIVRDLPDRGQYWIDQECPNADKHFRILRQREVMAIPKDTRQKVLDLFRSGMCIGDIRTELNLSLDVTAEIISMNIVDCKMLRSDSL